eukprot:9917095-Lingulodinium_polyedra.AAC.1
MSANTCVAAALPGPGRERWELWELWLLLLVPHKLAHAQLKQLAGRLWREEANWELLLTLPRGCLPHCRWCWCCAV